MSEYKMEKGIPLAWIRRRRPSLKYPFDQMEAGDSFFVPLNAGDELKSLCGRVTHATISATKRLGRKFTLRSGETGVRIWRTE